MSNTVNIYVNKADIGLDLVDNTSDLNKPISTATQTALNGKEDVSNKSTDVNLGTSDTLYPTQLAVKTYVDSHTVSVPDATASVKGIVKLTGDLGGTADSPTVPSLEGKETKITPQTASNAFHFDGKHFHATTGIGGALAPLTGNITLWGGQNYVGTTSTMLHNDSVEPTFSSEFERQADSLPYLTGQNNIIVATCVNQYPYKISYRIERPGTNIYSTFLTTDLKGANNGLAELDGSGKVPSSQLPSYVDDVLEYANLAAFPVTGTTATIYLAIDTNLTYRWGGSSYVEISPSLALGETSSSAYRGDRGKIAYDHSLLTSGNPHNVTKSDVGLSNVVNSDTTTTTNITDSLNKRFVTDAQLIILGNTSGTNTGDETATTIKSKLGITTLSGSNTGDQDLSNLVVKNVAITGATKTKITYDSKGLVTSGTDATTADIADSTNKRYVTDAQLTVIGNTSGTNTGDQDLSGYATKNLTLDRKTASYTLVSGDNNKLIEMNVATANNVTINNSIFNAGNQILVSQYGAGQVTFVAGAGVTLRSPSGKLKLTGQYSMATIICITANEFYIAGDLTA